MKRVYKTVKKLFAFCTAFVLLCVCAEIPAAAAYTDVPADHWAYEAIMSTTMHNWFSGYPDGSFRPDDTITRAEAIKVFVMAKGLELSSVSESSFYDVDPGAWYAPYVEAGKQLFPVHISVQGKRPFQPDMPATREDIVCALVNARGDISQRKYIDLSCLNMFSDKSSISESAKAHFAVAVMDGLVSGYSDGTIKAQNPLTRAEFAAMLSRGLEFGLEDNYTPVIQSVDIFPESSAEIEIGDSLELRARALYTDGKSLEYTELEPYVWGSENVISIDGSTVTGIAEGSAGIRFNSEYLRNEVVTVNVKKPSEGPRITVYSYPDETELDEVTVSGIVSHKELTDLKFICNGKDVVFNKDGSFSTRISLDPMRNYVKFAAIDKYGVMTEKTITIVRICPPKIHITEYEKNIASKTVRVSGYIEDSYPESVVLTAGDEVVKLDKSGTFSVSVDLNVMGPNNIVFRAENKYGKVSDETITVVRYEFYKGKQD